MDMETVIQLCSLCAPDLVLPSQVLELVGHTGQVHNIHFVHHYINSLYIRTLQAMACCDNSKENQILSM